MAYLQAVYWDLDGTIANTELEAHLPAFNKSFLDLNLDWYWDKRTYIDLLKINGGKNRINFFSKERNLDLSENFINQIHKQKQINYLNLINSGVVSLKIGVQRLINELSSKNIRQFIVTSSSRNQVELLIDKLFINKNPFEFFKTLFIILKSPNLLNPGFSNKIFLFNGNNFFNNSKFLLGGVAR